MARARRQRTARSLLAGGALLALATLDYAADTAGPGARDKYILFCAGCHGMDGEGGGGGGGMKLITPFVPSIGVFLNDPQGRVYLANVGGVTSAGMTEAETAQVLNYIVSVFGAASTPKPFVPYTPEEIRALREKRVDDPLTLRKEIGALLEQAGLQLPPYEWD